VYYVVEAQMLPRETAAVLVAPRAKVRIQGGRHLRRRDRASVDSRNIANKRSRDRSAGIDRLDSEPEWRVGGIAPEVRGASNPSGAGYG
jgi:hypothetical protein